MKDTDDIQKPFLDFAGANGQYFADVFLKIQKDTLSGTHFNAKAMLGSFIWAALRGNWLLFTIGFVLDLIAMVNLALVYKFTTAAADNADKAFLVERYEGWASTHLIAAVVVFVLGRLLFGWLADRLYFQQYNRWRIDHKTSSGFETKRLILAGVIISLILPLMIYRATQFAPDARTCVKQDRAIAKGEEVSFKAQFDCAVIGEFPTLIWLDRPDEISYPRNDAGERIVQRTPAAEGAPPVNLNTYTSQSIDDAINYLTVFYGFVFDGVTAFIRGVLSAASSVFVGTPWPITMGVMLFFAYRVAGTRTAIFVGASLVYLAVLGFWQTAMDTLSLVVASSLICVAIGLPLGVWIGKSNRARAIATPILDVMQTIPSFVFLLPVVAFLSIGKPPGILATVIFAMPPMVRLTALGIQQVPASTKEAALAFGASPRQLLYKVELPLALPSIMAGFNQVVMMSLAMVVIAAIIGAGGMGFIVIEALENTEVGRGILAGLGIALLAMMIDRVAQKANASPKK
ncbi:MAG: ABC transporter permease subunit [Pseudomonadota bacterium]